MGPVLRASLLPLLTVVVALGGCGGDPEELPSGEGAGAPGGPGSTGTGEVPQQIFDREFVFLSEEGDSTLLLPWLFRTRVEAGTVRREISLRIVRPSGWETLADESSDNPSLRNPERILPSARVRLVAGDDRQFESIYFRDPPREVEVRFLEILSEWPRPGGEPIFLYRGQVLLPTGATDGVILDFARRWGLPETPVGDWIFLQGDGGEQIFLEEDLPLQQVRTGALYRGWVRTDPMAGPWTDLSVEWVELRPFEPARRDIPARWRVASTSGDLEGELSATSSDLAVIPGDDPVRPAFGYFRVEGELQIFDQEIEVEGLVRHQQF